MTRTDYIKLAAALRAARDDIRDKEPDASQPDLLDGAAYAAEHIADALADGSRAFDRELFLRNAGVHS